MPDLDLTAFPVADGVGFSPAAMFPADATLVTATAGALTYDVGNGRQLVLTGGFMIEDGSVQSGTIAGVDLVNVSPLATLLSLPGLASDFGALEALWFGGTASAADVLASLLNDNDAVTGTAGHDILVGGDGNDGLVGGTGNDILDGGDGDDILFGGEGSDTIDGGSGADKASFMPDGVQGPFVLTLVDTDTFIVTAGIETIFEVKRLADGSFTVDDKRVGSPPGIDSLENVEAMAFHSASNEVAVGVGIQVADDGQGGLLVFGGIFADVFDPSTVPGLDTALAMTIDGDQGGDSLTGGTAGDTIYGGAGADTLSGDDGGDILYGGADDDSLEGGKGEDILYGGAGTDSLDGGEGKDQAYYLVSAGDVTGQPTIVIVNGTTFNVLFGNVAIFEVEKTAGGVTVTDLRDPSPLGTDTVTNVEVLTFGIDGSLNPADSVSVPIIPSVTVGANIDVAGTLFSDVFKATDIPGLTVATTVSINGLEGDDVLTGHAGSDLLYGWIGKDSLLGAEGNDNLDGGAGDDHIDGGAGNDLATFIEAVAAGTTAELADLDEDSFVVEVGGTERFSVLRNADGSLTVADSLGSLGTDTVTNVETLQLGVSSAPDGYVEVQVGVTVENVDDAFTVTGGVFGDTFSAAGIPGLPAGATVTSFGNTGADKLTGHAGADIMFGGDGNDTLDGSSGTNSLNGGNGNDTLEGGSGSDDLFGGDGVDRLTAGAGADTLDGGDGKDALDGGTGADTLSGGAGDDTISGGGGIGDTVVFTLAPGTPGTLATTGFDAAGGFIVTLGVTAIFKVTRSGGTYTVEDLRPPSPLGTDTVTDVDVFSFIIPNVDPNVDPLVLNVKVGATVALDDDGAYQVDGSVLGDVIDASDIEGIATASKVLVDAGEGNDTVSGHAGTDVIDGGAGNDVLDGKGGADTLVGGTGNDTYVIDAQDTVVEAPGGGIDTVIVSQSFTLGANLENLTAAAGAGGIALTGNDLGNVLTGNAFANLLDGKAGADTLAGHGGNDTYFVDSAADVIVEGAGEGSDTVIASVSYVLTAAAQVEIMKFAATKGNLSLTGNAFANAIAGNAGANVLKGGAGNDVIAGGLGKDTLTGGAGKDTFVFDTKAASANLDTIKDFVVKDDTIQLENKVFTKVGKGTPTKPGKLAKDAFFIGTKAHDKTDHVIYDSKSGALFYDADGSGSAAQIKIATLTKNLKMTYADVFVI